MYLRKVSQMRIDAQDYNSIQNQVSEDKKFRKDLCIQSHKWFFTVYLNSHIEYPSAKFHDEMFYLSEDTTTDLVVIVAFRGSAKSTIMSLSYPIWAMLGKLKKKHIVLIGQTQNQAKQILANIREELENNTLLLEDFGPFQEDASQWSANSLVIPRLGTRITSVSTGESIRGIRHRSFRPDLIICDDVESIESVKTKDGRDKTYRWFTSDVVPAGDTNTKIVVIGNLLHEDSLVTRLREGISSQKLVGKYREYPLLNEDETPLWLGKFKTGEDVKKLKQKVGDVVAFKREYLLQIVSDFDSVIYKEWLHYYTEIPSINSKRFLFGVIGVDLAISQNKSADKTAIVTILVFGEYMDWQAYVLPNPINAKLTFPEMLNVLLNLDNVMSPRFHLCIEKVAFQEALIQQLESKGVVCEGVHITSDKRSRLAITSAAVKNGLILFPEKGAEDLLDQLLNFGTERYDDLADAFSIAVPKVLAEGNKRPVIHFFVGGQYW